MKTEEIIEGNRLIAGFMGWDKFNTGTYETPYEDASYINGGPNHFCEARHLKFHSSWDWLMPVVEKIEQTIITEIEKYVPYTHQPFTIKIHHNSAKVCVDNDFKIESPIFNGVNFTLFDNGTKLESTWLAVVEFIKWYNENRQK